MRVLFVNSVCGIGSTGRICTDLARELEARGDEVKIAYGRGVVPDGYKKYAVKIGGDTGVRLHAGLTRLTDKHGLYGKHATKKFLEQAEKYDPELLWLHNIHGYYLNYELLFDWIKKRPGMRVKWTLHDCWAFTGHCAYFSISGCDKWQTGCGGCVSKREYPASVFADNSKSNYERKKRAFCGVDGMTLITPSAWLAELCKKSFLKEYPIKVIYNDIDRGVFKYTESGFRGKYSLEEKLIVLGVSGVWNDKKGYGDFLKLASRLDDRYRVVLVGLTEKQLKSLPSNITGIAHTNSARELAEIYSAADVFVNMTYEDNYPTVDLEAEACGTPVVVYDTGGCRETVRSEKSRVVPQGDTDSVIKAIREICSNE